MSQLSVEKKRSTPVKPTVIKVGAEIDAKETIPNSKLPHPTNPPSHNTTTTIVKAWGP